MVVTLKAVLGGIAVLSLLFNSGYAVQKVLGPDSGGWLGGNGNGESTSQEDLTVKVPASRLYDLITYQYNVFAEMYSKNWSSGDWEVYQLTIDGQLKRAYSKLVDAHDGFWVSRKCVEFDMDTSAKFEIFTDSSSGEPLTIPGSIDADRKEFIELNTEKSINAHTIGNVAIDRLPKYNVPLSFMGDIDAYLDPNRATEMSVDETLFGDGNPIKRGENGTFNIDTFYPEFNYTMGTRYNWTADVVQKIESYKTLRINITADMFGQETGNASMDTYNILNETIWISNDCSFPVKRYTITNQTSWDKDRGGNPWENRIVLETTLTMMPNGYSKGSSEIPWGNPGDTVFDSRHPRGEFTSWQTAPPDGAGMAGSGFEFGINEAVDEAMKNSSGVQDFFYKFDQPDRRVFLDSASFNASPDPTDINNRVGTYRWNLTFAVQPTRAESAESRQTGDRNFSYSIVIVDNVTKEIEKLRTVYKDNITIEHDWGKQRWSASLKREDIEPQGCSLASSEDIMLLDPDVVAKATSARTGKLDWKAGTYMLGAVGLGGSGPGFMMIETLTGMTFPTADYAWAFQSQTVYESGQTFSAAVDVETGRLVFVAEIQGTSLLGIFG
jgi:hypothetical protein